MGCALSSIPPTWETTEGEHAGGRGLARSLPCHLQGYRGRGLGKAVLQDTGKAVSLRQPSTFRKAKTLWKIREASSNGSEYYNQGNVQQIGSRVAVRQALWEKHLQNPMPASEKALKRTAAEGD